MLRPFSKLELTCACLEAEGGPDLVLARATAGPRLDRGMSLSEDPGRPLLRDASCKS
jgi:hypothetical protein